MAYNRELELIEPKEREVVMKWTNEWIESGKIEGRLEGRTEGRTQGRIEGRRETILRQLRRRFGPLPADLDDRIGALTEAKVDDLVEAVLDFRNIGDAVAWVEKNGHAG
jgi:predicted transposase YdaD